MIFDIPLDLFIELESFFVKSAMLSVSILVLVLVSL